MPSHLPPKPSTERFEDLPHEEQELVHTVATQLHLLAYRYVVPLTIALASEKTSASDLNSASASIVRANDGVFALTANHVVEKAFKRLRGGDDVTVFLSNTEIPFTERRSWFDPDADLALLDLSEEEATAIGSWVYDLRTLPDVPIPEVGSYVLAVGFPRYLRTGDDSSDLDFGSQGAVLRVTHAGSDYLLCQFERDQWVTSQEAIPPSGTPLGGLSGGPVFMMQQLHYPLVGVITEFHDAFEDLEVLRVQGIAHLPILRDIAASD